MNASAVFFAILTMIVTLCNCSQNGISKNAGDSSPQVFVGLASFYGEELTDKQTASGTKYDPMQLTAAHRTLPFGTRVKVTNLDNSQSVIVTISDRGPVQKERVIDVSYAAAQQLDMLSSGVVKVRVEVVND